MLLTSVNELQKTILRILYDYCNRYTLFKPTYYFLAKQYIDKLHKLEEKTDLKNVTMLKIGFEIYKSLVESKSEELASAIGLALARHLHVKECDYLKYRESKIWTQRYIHGFGLFECQIYTRISNHAVPDIEVDPIYNAYIKLNNQIKLSKVVTEDQVLCRTVNS